MLNRMVSSLRKAVSAPGQAAEKNSAVALNSAGSAPAACQLSDPLLQRIISDDVGSIDVDVPSFVANHKATGHVDYFTEVNTHFMKKIAGAADREAVLESVTFDKPVSKQAVLSCLRRYGIAIFPSLYSQERLEAVVGEFDDLIESGSDLATLVDPREETTANSYGLRLRRKDLPSSRFAELHALFGAPTLEVISKDFFSGQKLEFNEHLYAQSTGPTDAPASGVLHWDKQLTLKSWLYVSDGGPDYGAMRAAATSNAWLRYVREDAMHHGVPYGQIDNAVPEDNLAVISSGGPPGTFFLFVTDTAHGASPVSEGYERRIIRAQARPKRVAEWAAWAQKKK